MLAHSTLIRILPIQGRKRQASGWAWFPTGPRTPISQDILTEETQALIQTLKRLPLTTPNLLTFLSQFRDIIPHFTEDPMEHITETYALASPLDIEAVKRLPVLLISRLERPAHYSHLEQPNSDGTALSSNRVYPPAEHGTIGIIHTIDRDFVYDISDLPQEMQKRQKHIGQRLDKLETQFSTIPNPYFDKLLQLSEGNISALQAALLSTPTLPYFDKPLFDRDPEIKAMIQQLAEDYYTVHQKQTNKLFTVKPTPITLEHKTRFPMTEEMLALQQSHGPGVRRNKSPQDSREINMIHLTTPNNKQLCVQGNNEHEQTVLNTYVGEEMGAEGLKALAVLLSTYHELTGGRDQKADASIKIQDLLTQIYNGDKKHADDPDKQKKLMHIILFFARTWVTDMDKPVEIPRSKRRQASRKYTPLLILESLTVDENTGIRILKEVEFHLGKDFYNLQFGRHKQFYEVPTTLVLKYHSQREQQEIFLTFYLAYKINFQGGTSYELFPNLLLQSGLKSQDDIQHDDHRTRDAKKVLYALEHIEKDGTIRRDYHKDIDTILATEYFLGECSKDDLFSETYYRITEEYSKLQTKSHAELCKIRLTALKHLLNTNEDNFIAFQAGHAMLKQVKEGRKQCIATMECNENTKIATRSHRKKQGRKPIYKE